MLLGLLDLASKGFRLVHYQADPQSRVHLVPRAHVTNMGDAVSVSIDGHPVGGAPEGAQVRSVPCFRPGGVACNVTGVVSGGYTFGTNLGVVAWPGFRKGFPDAVVCGVARDGSVLLMSDEHPPAQEAYVADHAWMDRNGRRLEVGPADEVWMLPDGSVLGRAYRNPKGGYSNATNLPEGARAEAFIWRRRRRIRLGAWWPMDVSVRGVAIGFDASTAGFRFEDRERVGPLVKWERGRLTPLDFGDHRGCYLIRARPDGSFVLGVALSEADLRLGILTAQGFEILPRTIDGKPIHPTEAEVDDQGRIHLDDWQIVRR